MVSAEELVKKLGIKPAFRVVVLGASDEFLRELCQVLPRTVSLETELQASARPNIILVWPAGGTDLQQMFRRLRQAITPNGAIWAVIPKKTARRNMAVGVTFDQVQAAALSVDLVDNKIATFSSTEYGIRFVIRLEKRGV